MSTAHKHLWGFGHNSAGQPVVTREARDICTLETYFGDGDANAALIVRAVNSHDELLAALTDLLEFARNAVPEYQADNMAHYEAIARAAIAAAEGRTLATPPSSPP